MRGSVWLVMGATMLSGCVDLTWDIVSGTMVDAECAQCHYHVGDCEQVVNWPLTTRDDIVVPGDAGASFLIRKLEGDLGADEGVQMPLGKPAMPPEDIDAIRVWIDAGAKCPE